MTREEAILYLEHTCSDDFNLEEHQIQNRLNAIQFLLEENQELKQKYENAVADYEKTMFEKEQLNSLVNSCQEEIRQLKKQLEEYENELEKADSITQSCILNGKKESEISYRKCLNMLEKNKNQQKVFIKYLEDEINKWNYNYDSYNYEYEVEEPTAEELINKILQKYRSIIGVSNENN